MAKRSGLETALYAGFGAVVAVGIAYQALTKIPYLRENVYEPAKQAIHQTVEQLGESLSPSHYIPGSLQTQ